VNAETLRRICLAAVEFGYRAGEKGEWNLQMTLLKWQEPQKSPKTVQEICDGYGGPGQKKEKKP
jgi:hypothetical protein